MTISPADLLSCKADETALEAPIAVPVAILPITLPAGLAPVATAVAVDKFEHGSQKELLTVGLIFATIFVSDKFEVRQSEGTSCCRCSIYYLFKYFLPK
ncbi:MAG: hypothetical protein HW421_3913 [Ignavibacteria bacterium]|nr:hypothetical protein [Ignavibacteria bacterium]